MAYNRKNLEEADDHELADTIIWLEGFLIVRVTAVESARELVSAEQWAQYHALGMNSPGVKSIFEVQQMNIAVRAMLDDWYTRPSLLRKNNDPRFRIHQKKKKKKKGAK